MGMAQEDEYNNEEVCVPLSSAELKKVINDRRLELARLEAQAKELARREAAPKDPRWDKFTFNIQFRNSRMVYNYLAKRLPNGAIYTTGTGETKRFDNWDAMIRWMLSSDVRAVGDFLPLTTNYTVPSLVVKK